ncbi:MAG: hypothetical protein GYB49_08230 [Alphaproteobacteria bacterium]|nr:hypothetical protein [Hyphomonas sp.]MBR9807193.1 hypothetical protein [Alphaproteobacteria bacterium]|tara:strand:+ start:2291 stop:2908 length:618 start_codon:yes stop_codon:yes gene_type:complete
MNTFATRCIRLFVPATFLVMALVLLEFGTGDLGTRQALRATARLSLILFALVFVARPLHQLWPSPFSAWALRQRKTIGMCFGISLVAHIGLIIWLFVLHAPEKPEIVGFADLAIGIPGLLITMLMTVTSIRVIRRAMPGKTWNLLHSTGLYLVWFIFTACLINSLLTKSPPYPQWHYTPLIGLLIFIMTIRLLANRQFQTSTETR